MSSLGKLAVISLLAACSRDTKPAATTTARVPDEGPVPDLNLNMQRVDDVKNPDIAWENAPRVIDPGATEPQRVREAVAILRPTLGNRASGVVRFRDSGAGLDVFATVDGLPAGAHAFHVHVYGDCSANDASSAGPHFNFTGSSFDKTVGYVTGNLGEVRSNGDPTATAQSRHPAASLHGTFSLLGRAVVVHEKPNDPAITPDGGAGARIACGVIGIANAESQPVRQTSRR